MILVDSSVWIDYFRGAPTSEAERLDRLLGAELLLTGDLILTEVLQGFRSERDFNAAKKILGAFDTIILGGRSTCIQAAKNYRVLRQKGVTVRKTIDTIIASKCIEQGIELLYSDRDFDAFVKHLGLRSAMST